MLKFETEMISRHSAEDQKKAKVFQRVLRRDQDYIHDWNHFLCVIGWLLLPLYVQVFLPKVNLQLSVALYSFNPSCE